MIQCGIDRIQRYPQYFRGRRLGMVTSASAVDANLCPSYLAFHRQFPLQCLFSPEHGLSGAFGNWEEVTQDPVESRTGAALVSLYGNRAAKPVPKQWLDKLDAIVYDIQDLGTRFYTYISTMIRVMEDCADAGLELIILDRPALLGGEILEGGVLREEYRSFIGPHPLPIRYGLTVGELAGMVNDERQLGCKLRVIPCEGWRRTQMFPDFGGTWVKPSGAISDFETALLYPGMCLFEGTNLSEGRGTGQTFRLVGAPFVDGQQLSGEMNALGLPGVAFLPAEFTPISSKFKDRRCEGVRIQVTDRFSFRSVLTGVCLLRRIQELWPEQVTFCQSPFSADPHIHHLSGCDVFQAPFPSAEEIWKRWEGECEAFRVKKENYHLYP